MVKRTLKVVLVGAVLIASFGIYIGYRFYGSGEDYGQALQVSDAATERTTRTGSVVGFADVDGSHTWMGIPYASPPVGELRWKAPRRPQPWDGTLQALKARDFCKQLGSRIEAVHRRSGARPSAPKTACI